VRVRGRLTERGLELMRRMAQPGRKSGAGGGAAVRSRVEVVKELGKVSVLRITLHEGRNRQVRRLCDAAGLHVVRLKRLSFGPVSIRKLPVGSVRPLEPSELERLEKLIGGSE
jgi:23S rRNA pseudouridine2605 synthase